MAATTASPPPPKSKLKPNTVRKAVNALLKWRTSQTTQNPDLLSSFSEFIYLVLTLNKTPPKSHINSFNIPLPNPLLPESTQFCLIYDDRTSNLTMDQIQNRIKSQNLPTAKALKLSKLKSDYKSFVDKRKLLESYDGFLADRRIVDVLPRCLGKVFYRKKRMVPVPVDLQRKDWKEQVDGVVKSAMLFLGGGTCSVVRVGRGSMSVEEVVENVVAAVEGIVEIVPRKWRGVRSFHLKMLESLALPVWQAVPDEMLLRMEGGKDGNNEKQGKKKSRISEVRYLDRNVGEVVDGGEFRKAKRSKNAAV